MKSLGGIRLKMDYARSAQWRLMTKGEDKWKAFCEASVRWRSERDVVGDDTVLSGDEASDDEVDEAKMDIPDGLEVGFDATGERGLLLRERRLRAELAKASDAYAQQPGHPADWQDCEDEVIFVATVAAGVRGFHSFFPLDFLGISLEFPVDFLGISCVFPFDFQWIS